ncbi:MAG: hypothetical protein R3F37_12825 [Candidatus Competibacteraceae bacterium]
MRLKPQLNNRLQPLLLFTTLALLWAIAGCQVVLVEKPGSRQLAEGLALRQQGRPAAAAENLAAAVSRAHETRLRGRALSELAELHLEGIGGFRDQQQGLGYLQQAAAAGYAPAVLMLAETHRTGSAGRQDLPEAARLYRSILDESPAAGIALAALIADGSVPVLRSANRNP